MHRYLIVAHRTLGGAHLLEEIERRRAYGECEFELLVPMEHPGDHAFTEGECREAAGRVLQDGLARLAERGITATGSVGDVNPVYAVEQLLLRGRHYDEILLSTLPAGPSKWLHLDVPRRLSRAVTVPVTVLVAENEPAH